jgi:hypothetical protein
MDDIMAILDSCSLKHKGGLISQRMPVGLSVKDEKREHRAKACTFASSLPYSGEVGDERREESRGS